MVIKNGKCLFCGRDFSGEITEANVCPSDDCPSHELKGASQEEIDMIQANTTTYVELNINS